MKPNEFRQRCLLRSHWTFGVTQGGQQSSQPGGLHFWQRAVSHGMNCTFLCWLACQEMKSFGREVRNLASRWAVQFVIAWTTAPNPTYLSDKYYHVLMREWNLVISGVKRTKTFPRRCLNTSDCSFDFCSFGFPERLDRSEERQMSFKSELDKSHEVANWKHTWDHEMGFACFCCES